MGFPVRQSHGKSQALKKEKEIHHEKRQTPSCLRPSFALCCLLKAPSVPTQTRGPRPALLSPEPTLPPPQPLRTQRSHAHPGTQQACCCPSHQNARYPPPQALCPRSLQPRPAMGIGRSRSSLQRVGGGAPGNQARLGECLPPQAAAGPAFHPPWPNRAM